MFQLRRSDWPMWRSRPAYISYSNLWVVTIRVHKMGRQQLRTSCWVQWKLWCRAQQDWVQHMRVLGMSQVQRQTKIERDFGWLKYNALCTIRQILLLNLCSTGSQCSECKMNHATCCWYILFVYYILYILFEGVCGTLVESRAHL